MQALHKVYKEKKSTNHKKQDMTTFLKQKIYSPKIEKEMNSNYKTKTK